MSRIASYAASIGMAATVFYGGTALGRSQVTVSSPPASSSVAEVPSTSDEADLAKSPEALCDKFYSTMESKKKNEALKHNDATVAAIDQVEIILKKRDAALDGTTMSAARPTLEKAESEIDAVIPAADRSWYALIRKNRYDFYPKYAPVCPTGQ